MPLDGGRREAPGGKIGLVGDDGVAIRRGKAAAVVLLKEGLEVRKVAAVGLQRARRGPALDAQVGQVLLQAPLVLGRQGHHPLRRPETCEGPLLLLP